MNKADIGLCSRAIAYLKVQVPSDDTSVSLTVSGANAPVITTLGGGLLSAYLVDEDTKFSYIQHRHLHADSYTEANLRERATANLRLLAESKVEVRQYGSIYAALMGGNFEASLLLVHEFWSDWYEQLAPGGFVVAIPARDVLAFGDISSARAIGELRDVCNRATAGSVDHALTSTLYRRNGEVWQPFHG